MHTNNSSYYETNEKKKTLKPSKLIPIHIQSIKNNGNIVKNDKKQAEL